MPSEVAKFSAPACANRRTFPTENLLRRSAFKPFKFHCCFRFWLPSRKKLKTASALALRLLGFLGSPAACRGEAVKLDVGAGLNRHPCMLSGSIAHQAFPCGWAHSVEPACAQHNCVRYGRAPRLSIVHSRDLDPTRSVRYERASSLLVLCFLRSRYVPLSLERTGRRRMADMDDHGRDGGPKHQLHSVGVYKTCASEPAV